MTIIPQDLLIRAIDNLKNVLARVPEGKAMNDMVDAEIRRLMKREHPGVTVTDKDINIAMHILADDRARERTKARPNLMQTVRNPNRLTVKDLEERVLRCSGFVKMMCGVSNNAALLIMMDCLNKIADVRSKESYKMKPYRPHPKYKHAVKEAFRRVLDEKRNYRNALLYASGHPIRFFHVASMPEETRKLYANLTDKEYFEFWEGTGAQAYQKSQVLIGSLHNKFRLSMLNQNVQNEDLVAWGLVGATVLELAITIYDDTVRYVFEACEGLIDMQALNSFFDPFSLRRVSRAWQNALTLMAPETRDYSLNCVDERNAALGVIQLQELWGSPDMPYDAVIAAVKDFQEDIFSKKSYAKKMIRDLTKMKNNAING